jgi:hypothetical protein
VFAAAADLAVEDQADLVGPTEVEVSRITSSNSTLPLSGRSSIWVRLNSACRIEMS